MKVHHGPPDERLGPTALAIGSFDGLHLGHQVVIGHLTASGLVPVVMTFEPHPRCVLDPDNCPASLTTLDEKVALLEGLGVRHLVVAEFTRELAAMSAADFMAMVLAAGDLRRLVCGADFALGRGRQGNVEWLADYGRRHGFETQVVQPVADGEQEVHSSEIRKLLTLGEVAQARTLLGRDYSLSGIVEHGFKVGRELGFPTVNVSVEPGKLVPRRGVYAGRAFAEGVDHVAAISVGYRPTFGGTQLLVEAFLLDYEGDLYQRHVTLSFASRLRDEVRFATREDLVEQMRLDVAETRSRLESA